MVTPYPGVTSLVIKQVCIDLDSAGKTRSMCRFCCKKDNVSQPATTWFVTREVFSLVLPKFYVFDGQYVIKRISES